MKRVFEDQIFPPTFIYETEIGYRISQVVGYQGSTAKEDRYYLVWKVGIVSTFLISFYILQEYQLRILLYPSLVLMLASVVVLIGLRPHQEYRVRNFAADFDRNTIVMKLAITGYDDVLFGLHENGFFAWDGNILSYRYGLNGANAHPKIKFPIKGIETKNYGQKVSNPDEVTGLVAALNHVHDLAVDRPVEQDEPIKKPFNPMD